MFTNPEFELPDNGLKYGNDKVPYLASSATSTNTTTIKKKL